MTGSIHMGVKYEYEKNFRGGIRYIDRDGWSTIREFNEVKDELTFIRPEAQSGEQYHSTAPVVEIRCIL